MISFQEHVSFENITVKQSSRNTPLQKKPDWAIQMSTDGAPPSPRSPRKVSEWCWRLHISKLRKVLRRSRTINFKLMLHEWLFGTKWRPHLEKPITHLSVYRWFCALTRRENCMHCISELDVVCVKRCINTCKRILHWILLENRGISRVGKYLDTFSGMFCYSVKKYFSL